VRFVLLPFAAVVALMRLSASQVQTFIDCQRKWAYKYLDGIEEPPNASAELGRAVHAELEKYLKGGEIDFTTEIGYIAASGLQHLPKPGAEGMRVEEEFHFEGPSGHTYLGYKDLEMPRVVYDHKSTGDLKWQKTKEDLKTDIQATLYAVDYFRGHPDEPEVELRWVYYQTKGTKKSAITVVTRYQVEAWDRFLEIEQVAQQMQEASAKKTLELPPNINHCGAYGGCPHQGRCNLSPFDKMRAHMEQNKLLASLQAKKNGAGAAVTGTVPAGVPTPPASPAPVTPAASSSAPTGNRLLARLQANGAPAASAVPAAAINPPEYQPPPAPPAAAAAPAASLPIPAVVPVMPAPPQASQAPSDGQTPPAVATDAPRGRGRPKKATAPATGVTVKIETLYIDCGPVGVAVTDATDFIILAKKRVAAEGLADYRFAEFGHGPGMLAVAAAAELDALEGVLPAVRLDTTTPEGSIIAVEFMARAGLVVR
jgi:CRISPR/Cas system-associated exonuclease Cas4 (RecB family)